MWDKDYVVQDNLKRTRRYTTNTMHNTPQIFTMENPQRGQNHVTSPENNPLSMQILDTKVLL